MAAHKILGAHWWMIGVCGEVILIEASYSSGRYLMSRYAKYISYLVSAEIMREQHFYKGEDIICKIAFSFQRALEKGLSEIVYSLAKLYFPEKV